MKLTDKLGQISRRDLFRVAGTYGMSSTLLAAGSFGGAMTLANLAKAAESTYEKRFAKEAKFTLKFGAAGFNARNLLIVWYIRKSFYTWLLLGLIGAQATRGTTNVDIDWTEPDKLLGEFLSPLAG